MHGAVMPVQKFSDRWLASLPFRSADEGQTEYFDADPKHKGLALIVGSRRKTWFLNYTAGGKRKRFKLGEYPALGLASARGVANEARLKVATGGDPMAEKKAEKAETIAARADTFELLINAYLESPAFADNKPGYRAEFERALKKDVIPLIGSTPVRDLSRRTLLRPCDVKASAGASRSAALLFRYQSRVLSWAHASGRIEANPMPPKYADEIASEARERVLTDAELVTLWKWAEAHKWAEFGDLLRLLLLTGQRLTEVAGARAAEFDFAAKTWAIPGERAKNGLEQFVYLAPMALEIAKRRATGDYLFPQSEGDKRPHIFRDTVGLALRRWQSNRKVKDVDRFTAHDLRRTMATRMNEAGVDPHIVEACLNHVSTAASGRAGVAGVYNRAAYAEPKREAWKTWEAELGPIFDRK
jgi:integrase